MSKPLPTTPLALQSRMIAHDIGDAMDLLVDRASKPKQISREAGVPNKQPASNNGD